MKRPFKLFALTLAVAGVAAACDEAPTTPAAPPAEVAAATGSALHANAAFPVLHEGFNRGTGLWTDNDIAGFEGWCGEIEQVDRHNGPVQPSAGRGYALVSSGPCNAFWNEIFPPEVFGFTAPYGPYEVAPPGESPWFSSRFPESGYVHDLDIYLDPAWEDFSVVYLVSVRMLDEQTPFGSSVFRYFAVFIQQTPGGLLVNGHPVDEAGWYTFRFRFSEDDGGLGVEFELRQNGRVILSHPVNLTFPLQTPGPENPSGFDVSNIGSGYSWFLTISSGFELPIDEQRIRPGR